ncbi:very short patch repair endonuclease [Methylobacterium sp. J-090]|uniref:very short patch repair endonuclease n=1 Tax=Methylobacterium sp. J-090 TaxID=2836666 RepID=UPI002445294A|nr:very short patch repair endonuclease [Methylobacterium sp. J-090]
MTEASPVVDLPVDASRSALMGRIKGKDTKPEMIVRRLAHRLGYRFRLHRRDLPGSPDLVFPSRRKVVFVHGCFWHRHPGCRRASTPSTRRTFWQAKFDRNVERDIRQEIELMAAGWEVLVIWECETRDLNRLNSALINFLEP